MSKRESPRRSLTVNNEGTAQYKSISDALASASEGDQILIFPGVYDEHIFLTSNIELLGVGNNGDTVIRSSNETAIVIDSDSFRVENLTVRQTSPTGSFAIHVTRGSGTVAGCDISSAGLACVNVNYNASPYIFNNIIHSGNDAGVIYDDNSGGKIESNDIYNNSFAGIEIKGTSNPSILSNQIHAGKEAGILVHESGRGMITGNDIFDNNFAGIEVRNKANPKITRNRVHGGRHAGIFFHNDARGSIKENEIFNNMRSGIAMELNANPTVEKNIIKGNGESGIRISKRSGGFFQYNEIVSNSLSGVEISDNSRPRLASNIISFNLGGIMLHNNGGGEITDNDLRYNQKGSIYVSEDSFANLVESNNMVQTGHSIN